MVVQRVAPKPSIVVLSILTMHYLLLLMELRVTWEWSVMTSQHAASSLRMPLSNQKDCQTRKKATCPRLPHNILERKW